MKKDLSKKVENSKNINDYDAKELIELLKTDTKEDNSWWYIVLLLVTLTFSGNSKNEQPINIYINGDGKNVQ